MLRWWIGVGGWCGGDGIDLCSKQAAPSLRAESAQDFVAYEIEPPYSASWWSLSPLPSLDEGAPSSSSSSYVLRSPCSHVEGVCSLFLEGDDGSSGVVLTEHPSPTCGFLVGKGVTDTRTPTRLYRTGHMTMIINMDTRTINVNKRPEKIYSA